MELPIICPGRKLLLVPEESLDNILLLTEFKDSVTADGGGDWGPYWNIQLVVCNNQHFKERQKTIFDDYVYMKENYKFIEELSEYLREEGKIVSIQTLANAFKHLKAIPKKL